MRLTGREAWKIQCVRDILWSYIFPAQLVKFVSEIVGQAIRGIQDFRLRGHTRQE